MTYSIHWTDLATSELNENIGFIAENGFSGYARKLRGKIDKSISYLVDNPRMYRESYYMRGCRDIVVDNYLVIYRVEDVSREVHILRVFHGARDIAALLL